MLNPREVWCKKCEWWHTTGAPHKPKQQPVKTFEEYVEFNLAGMSDEARHDMETNGKTFALYKGIWYIQWLQWEGQYELAEKERLDMVRHLRVPVRMVRRSRLQHTNSALAKRAGAL